jgi:beta-glucosidase
MTLQFPDHFFWGSSTSAPQTETAFDHQWKGLKARDGFIFDRTTDHEKRRMEDAEFIKQFGTVYRCGVDWSKLQRAAFAPFEEDVVEEYQEFFAYLKDEGVGILLVLHHFANPVWFEKQGGWLREENIPVFLDFATRCMEAFGEWVVNWNTFNEPNVYAANCYLLGVFPPHKKGSLIKADRVLKHMSICHESLYKIFKERYPDKPVGISLNTAWFKGLNFLGRIPALLADWWFNRRAARFFELVDYWGLSYYAFIPFDPLPVTEVERPGRAARLGIRHDKMWCYYPQGFAKIIRRFHNKYHKPVIITESGICTDDPRERINNIKDYLKICHEALQQGVDLRGYIHWATWDNFEWNLGPTYRFGLVKVDLETMERTMTEAGLFYAQVIRENSVTL